MLIHVHIDGRDRVLTLAEFEERVRAGTVGPETPVRQGDAGGFRPARELPGWSELADTPAVRVRRWIVSPPVPWMTAVLVGVLWRVHAWLDGPARRIADERLCKLDAAIVEHGEGWRVLTYALLHADLNHVASNLLFLLIAGVALEALVGPWAVLALFLLSVGIGGVLSSIGAETPTIGASAGDFGFMAAAAVAGIRWGSLLPPRAKPFFGGVVTLYLLQALWGGLQSSNADNHAHVGGLVAGAALMAFLRPVAVDAWRRSNRVVLVVAYACLAGAVTLLLLRPVPMEPAEEDGLRVERPARWNVGWAASGDRGWVSPLGDAWVVAHTEELTGPQVPREVAEAMLERWRALPGAAFEPLVQTPRNGIDGYVAQGGWTKDGVARRVRLGAWARGHYVHVLAVDVPADDGRRDGLLSDVVDGAEFVPLAAADDADAAPDTARGRVQRARVQSKVGDIAAARANLAEARALAPSDTVPVLASLEIAAAWKADDASVLAEDALARFPEERAVTAAAARALDAAGAEARAADVLRAAWGVAPGDRTLERVALELDVALEPADAPAPPLR